MFIIQWDRTSFDVPVWICIDDAWLYMHETLDGVINQIDIEYRHDKHLVG